MYYICPKYRKKMNRLVILLLGAVAALATACRPEGHRASAPHVKNVILMIGDGMGAAQLTALMLERGSEPVAMERAAIGGLVKTHSANNRVTDSAAAGTAYATGDKTNNGAIGVDTLGMPLETILEKAERAGFFTGIVATQHVMHATPAAFYAHVPDRNLYEDIALGLLPSGIDVAIGGGRRYLTERADGRNLVEELEKQGYIMVDSLEALDEISDLGVMALYDDSMPYVRDGRRPDYLARATSKALEILTPRQGRKTGGFFLMVEGSFIDNGGHDNDPALMLDEVRDFDAAVAVAFDYADAHPGTLVVVLADHETGGLTLPSGNANFLLPDSGVEFQWSTPGHSGTLVPMFAYGAQADQFGGILDNTEVNHRLEQLLGLE